MSHAPECDMSFPPFALKGLWCLFTVTSCWAVCLSLFPLGGAALLPSVWYGVPIPPFAMPTGWCRPLPHSPPFAWCCFPSADAASGLVVLSSSLLLEGACFLSRLEGDAFLLLCVLRSHSL